MPGEGTSGVSEAELGRVEVRGARLAVVEKGEGDSLVLVHGTVSDYRSWSDVQARFARDHRTIAYSRRYHWPNEPIPEGADYAMLEQAEDLAALLEAVDAGPAHLVGHSYGGYLALLVAMRRPEAVRSLVMTEPPVIPLFASVPPKPLELLKLLFTRPSAGIALLRFGASGMGPATEAFERGEPERGLQLFAGAVLGEETFESISEERMEQVRDNLIAEEFLGSGFVPVSDEDIAAIPHPSLLIGSGRSAPIFRHVLDRLEELIPTVERADIPSASHNVHEDAPEAFHRAVTEFLDRR